MKRALIAAAFALMATAAYAEQQFTAAEIAAFPQDAVKGIKEHCSSRGHDYEMRLYCENKQYAALKQFLERNKETSK